MRTSRVWRTRPRHQSTYPSSSGFVNLRLGKTRCCRQTVVAVPRLELAGQVVVERVQRVVAEEPGRRPVQAPVRRRSRRRLVRPQVRLPQLVGAVGQRRLHQPQRLFEVVGHAVHKRVRHTRYSASRTIDPMPTVGKALGPVTTSRRRGEAARERRVTIGFETGRRGAERVNDPAVLGGSSGADQTLSTIARSASRPSRKSLTARGN